MPKDDQAPPRPLRKLSQTLGGFKPGELQAARAALEPPRPEANEDEAIEAPLPQGTAVAVAVATPAAANPEYDLDRMSATADNFMQGLDKVSDVLTILVLKFGRVSRMLLAVLVFMAVGVVFFGGSLLMNWAMLDKIDDLTNRQKKLAEQVQERSNDNHEESMDLKKQVDALTKLILEERAARLNPPPLLLPPAED